MGRYTRKGYELDQTGQEAQDLLNAINNKVDKEDGKSLISDEDKAKLDNIEERAQRNTIETIKRNGVALPIDDKGVNISVPTKVADLEQDYTHRTVTDAEKDKWNDKQEKPAPVRYAVLKSMRDTGGLTVGKTYRITDYVATVRRSAQYSEAMSANHPFDIIVTAIDERHLSEECLAAMHEGDIYFANSDLSAWKIWYTIDNDTAAYDWADPANGKGVIYRMIDEYANDLGYDFKGILIARHPVAPAEGYESVLSDISGMWLGPKGSAVPAGITVDTTQTKWFYTFSHLNDGWDNPTDASLRKGIKAVYNATITSIMRPNIRFLSGNVFMNGPFVVSTLEALAGPGSEITDAHVWHFRAMGDCSNNTFFGYAGCSDCMSQLRYNIFVGDFRHNRLATDVEGNTIVAPGDISFNDIWCANMVVRAREFSRNSGGGYTSGTVLKTSGYVSYNKFPNYFADNRITATGNISANEFGTSFYQNTFTLTGQFTGNKFTGYCYENNIGCSNFTNNEAAYFHANTISTTEGVNACVFGPYFESNTLGGRLTNVRFSSGQTRFCNFSGIVGCTFDGIMEYVTVPTVSGKRFTHCDVRGGVRGTSSVPVVLDYDAFFLASAAGVSRRVTIEGSADGKIVAMWADGGALKGVMKAPNGNWADMGFVTKAVNDLLNYYLKSETYTKTEVNQLVAGINNWEIVSVAQLPEASADTMHKIYFVPSSNPEARNVKDEYITIENSGIYSWEQIGSTTIDLTNYVTKQEFTIALADYVTSSAFTQALATKQDTLVSGQNIKTINGFSILGGGNLYFPGPVQSDWNEDDDGDDAYIKNKPTDLVHYDELSPTDPISTPNYATEEEVSQLRSEVNVLATYGRSVLGTTKGYYDKYDGSLKTSTGNYYYAEIPIPAKAQTLFVKSNYDSYGNEAVCLFGSSFIIGLFPTKQGIYVQLDGTATTLKVSFVPSDSIEITFFKNRVYTESDIIGASAKSRPAEIIPFTDGYAYKNNGSVGDTIPGGTSGSTTWSYATAKVKAGDIIELSAIVGGGISYNTYALVDNDNKIISCPVIKANVYNGIVTVPVDGMISVNTRTSRPDVSSLKIYRAQSLPLVGKKVAIFGDSIVTLRDTDGFGIAEYLTRFLGCDIVRCSIGGLFLSCRVQTPVAIANITDLAQCWPYLDLGRSIPKIATGDMTDINTVYQKMRDDFGYTPSADMATAIYNWNNIDFDEIDAVIISAGTNDQRYAPEGAATDDVPYTLNGAVNIIVKSLLENYPHLSVYFFSPIVKFVENDLDQWSDDYVADGPGMNGKTLAQVAEIILGAAKRNHIPNCDMYYGMGWTRYNFLNYCNTDINDYTHPYKGFRQMAEKMAGFITANRTFD